MPVVTRMVKYILRILANSECGPNCHKRSVCRNGRNFSNMHAKHAKHAKHACANE